MIRYILIVSFLTFTGVCDGQTDNPDTSVAALKLSKMISNRIGEQVSVSDEGKNEIVILLVTTIREMKNISKSQPDKLEAAKLKFEVKEKMLAQIRARFGNDVFRALKKIISPPKNPCKLAKRKPAPQTRVGRIL